MQKQILIVAKEDTIPIAAASFDIIKQENKYNPKLLLITPLEEIIYKKAVKKYLFKRDYILCWPVMRKFLNRKNLNELLRKKNKHLYQKLNYEICSHPTQLYDLNRRIQYRNNKPEYLKHVLFAQSLYLDEVLKNYANSEIIDFTVYDISRTILLLTSQKYNIIYKSLIRSRFENYIFCTKNLGDDIPKKLKNLKLDKKDILRAKESIQRFKRYKDITSEADKSSIPNKYSFQETYKIFINIIRIMYSLGIKIYKLPLFYIRNRYIFKYYKYIFGNGFLIAFNTLLKEIRNIWRIWKPLKQKIKIKKNFIYFPMPNTIENSETRFNRGILSEKILINFLRPYLGNSVLLIKDHRSMLRDRTFEEIKSFSDIVNSIYISEWGESWKICNPLHLIKNSILNITIAGTAGLESAILGQPVAILGEPIYGRFFELNGYKFKSIREITQSLSKGRINKSNYLIDKDIVIKFIASTIKEGIDMNVYFMIQQPFNKANQIKLKKLLNFVLNK
tara:strand:+ start:615 stop:2129 length:1515 start_codon:yes stop_codon:yes gene_type:complete